MDLTGPFPPPPSLQDPTIWATLAAMAMAAKELNTAEVAFAAIDEVDKLHFVCKVKQVPTEEGRNAELALYRRRPDEAEAILIQVGCSTRLVQGISTLVGRSTHVVQAVAGVVGCRHTPGGS